MIGVFLDTETTGLNPKKHRIIEIAYRMVDLLTGEEISAYHTVVKIPKKIFDLANPISLQINGFTYEEIKQGLEEEEVKKLIVSSFDLYKIERKKAVFICQNPSFDRAFFSKLIDTDEQEERMWPYHWLDLASMYWSISLKSGNYPWKMGVSKDQIAAQMGLPKEPSPHRAKNGVDHLIACYKNLVGFPSK